MSEFLAVVMITLLAVISPGADFAIITKNSYLYGRKFGIFTAIGIALGVLVHITYALISLSLVVEYIPQLLNIIKYLGAIYLIYLGYKTFTQPSITDAASTQEMTPIQAIRYGFLTNALNPKTTLFVVSTYTQIISTQTAFILLLGYGIFMSLAHFIWFTLVALVFSSNVLRQKMLDRQRIINQIIGAILCLLGITLIFITT